MRLTAFARAGVARVLRAVVNHAHPLGRQRRHQRRLDTLCPVAHAAFIGPTRARGKPCCATGKRIT